MTQNKGGRLKSSGLFKELKGGGPDAPYSLDEFKEVFLQSRDSTGYLCAQAMLNLVEEKDRWVEWKRLFLVNPELRRYYKAWQEELEIRVRAEAESIVASGCNKETFPRLRWILEGNLYGKSKVGRPTKGEISKKQRIEEGVKALNKKDKDKLDNVIEIADARTV